MDIHLWVSKWYSNNGVNYIMNREEQIKYVIVVNITGEAKAMGEKLFQERYDRNPTSENKAILDNYRQSECKRESIKISSRSR